MQEMPGSNLGRLMAVLIRHPSTHPHTNTHTYILPAFYVTRGFNIVYTRASHFLCPEPDQSKPYISAHFLKINFNYILLSTPRSSKWLFSFRFLQQSTVLNSPLRHMCHMPCPSYNSCFAHPNIC